MRRQEFISLAGSVAGTYTVTNTVAASGGCAAVTSTATFRVNPVPITPTIIVTGTPVTGITLTSSAATGTSMAQPWPGPRAKHTSHQLRCAQWLVHNGDHGHGGCASAASAAVTATNSAQAGTTLTLYANPTPTGQLAVELTISNALEQRLYVTNVALAALAQP